MDRWPARRSADGHALEKDPVGCAARLLDQQLWCWGRDVLRPAGNWLLEHGFSRLEPPADYGDCSSVYLLQRPGGRCVVLRGFGVFQGDRRYGGVFLPRYDFRPRYTTKATLECPPWFDADLPQMSAPNDSQRAACASLTLDLIDWIRSYEVSVAEKLGVEYRRSTLRQWDNGKRLIIPAEEMAAAWRLLGLLIARNPVKWMGPGSDGIGRLAHD